MQHCVFYSGKPASTPFFALYLPSTICGKYTKKTFLGKRKQVFFFQRDGARSCSTRTRARSSAPVLFLPISSFHLPPPPILLFWMFEEAFLGSVNSLRFGPEERKVLAAGTQPAMVVCKNGSSVGTRTRCTHVFARLAPICMLSRCLSTKISAAELSRKFIQCALLVGYAAHTHTHTKKNYISHLLKFVIFWANTWISRRENSFVFSL